MTAAIATDNFCLASTPLTSLSEKFEATVAITSASEVNWVRTDLTSSLGFTVSAFSLSASFLSACSLSDFSFSALSVTSFSATGVASVLASSFTSGFSSTFTASIFNSGSSSTTGVVIAESGFCLSGFVISGAFVVVTFVSSALTAFVPNRRAVPNRTLATPKLYLRIEKRWALLPWYFSVLEYIFSPFSLNLNFYSS